MDSSPGFMLLNCGISDKSVLFVPALLNRSNKIHSANVCHSSSDYIYNCKLFISSMLTHKAKYFTEAEREMTLHNFQLVIPFFCPSLGISVLLSVTHISLG